MKQKTIIILILFLLSKVISAQAKPHINIIFSKLLATYHFVQKLSNDFPGNEYTQVFAASKFNEPHYTKLVKQFGTLDINQSYQFEGYPAAQKRPVTTSSLIERNLINATSLQEFKSLTFGLIPNDELFALSNIISEFELVYDSLVYVSNKDKFEKKLNELKHFVETNDLAGFFETGLHFYDVKWDYSIPTQIAIIPSISNGGFTANAFLNNAISEVPINFEQNDILFSVLMHEIFHNIYDGQSLQVKLNVESWFKKNPSVNSQYAYLLLNEALATALGNGYVYEQLTTKTDSEDWYNVKYINLMAKKIYPVVKEYLTHKKPIDKEFVDKYIAAYEVNFPGWAYELDNLFTNRYVITDNGGDLDYFGKTYRYASIYQWQTSINTGSLERMKQTSITKVIIVSSDHKSKLSLIKNTFSELNSWKYNAKKDFIYTTTLEDKTTLIIVNSVATKFEELFEKKFKDKQLVN